MHAFSIYFMHYNFVWIHQTLRYAPAMEVGVTDRLWSLEDMGRACGRLGSQHPAKATKLTRKISMLRTMEQCLEDLRKYGLGDFQYKAAQAEREILIAQEYLALLQKTRENLYEVLAEMNTQILRFREVVDRAAADGSRTSKLLVRWTKVLAITTGGLVFATLVLVFATPRIGH